MYRAEKATHAREVQAYKKGVQPGDVLTEVFRCVPTRCHDTAFEAFLNSAVCGSSLRSLYIWNISLWAHQPRLWKRQLRTSQRYGGDADVEMLDVHFEYRDQRYEGKSARKKGRYRAVHYLPWRPQRPSLGTCSY